MFELTFGTDPEFFFLYEEDGEKKIISPAMLQKDSGLKQIGGNVKHPVYFKNNVWEGIGDGAAYEINFKTPFSSMAELFQAMVNALDETKEKTRNLTWKGKELTLVTSPAEKIDKEVYLPFLDREEIYMGFIAGCDADYDAVETYKCETVDLSEHKYRYGGGHFHIGSPDIELRKRIQQLIIPFIQLQALTLGNCYISRSPYIEKEKIRMGTYGRPTRYRPQIWGSEYRSPSNSWTTSLETALLFEELSYKSVDLLLNPEEGVKVLEEFLTPTIKAITSCNQQRSAEILEELI